MMRTSQSFRPPVPAALPAGFCRTSRARRPQNAYYSGCSPVVLVQTAESIPRFDTAGYRGLLRLSLLVSQN